MSYKLLDLFCCAGGAGMGYHRAGFDVVGVDIKPQPHYPFEFHQADALEYLAEHWQEFDVIHASPPCQDYSITHHLHPNKNYPRLIDPVRELLVYYKKPFIIENVVGAPIRIDLLLCGSMFGLGIRRHRIFESNVPMPILTMSCKHENLYDPWHGGKRFDLNHQEMARHQREQLSANMGIDWFMTRPEVREAIPPAYTEWIGKQILQVII